MCGYKHIYLKNISCGYVYRKKSVMIKLMMMSDEKKIINLVVASMLVSIANK